MYSIWVVSSQSAAEELSNLTWGLATLAIMSESWMESSSADLIVILRVFHDTASSASRSF
eukprot:5635418-Amphidinium_carterae.1